MDQQISFYRWEAHRSDYDSKNDWSPYEYFIDEENIRTDSFIDWIRESKQLDFK